MECLFCGKSLYKHLSFNNLFKLSYIVHDNCLMYNLLEHQLTTFPLGEKVIQLHAIFKFYDKKMNENGLFLHYGNILYQALLNTFPQDFLFFDERDKQQISTLDLQLILPMFGQEVHFYTLFHNNVIGL